MRVPYTEDTVRNFRLSVDAAQTGSAAILALVGLGLRVKGQQEPQSEL